MQFEPEAAHASIDLILSHRPQAAFLTHYGRVGQLPRLADELHRMLDDFVSLAGDVRDAGKVRHGLLVEILQGYLLERLSGHGVRMEREKALALLANDVELNAQGLEVWLDQA